MYFFYCVTSIFLDDDRKDTRMSHRSFLESRISIPALGICWMPEQRCCVLRKMMITTKTTMFSVLMKTFAVFFCLQRRKRRTILLFHELLSVFWDISHCCVLQLCGFTVVFHHTELCSQQRPRGHWCLSCCGSCVFSVVFDKGSISLSTWSCVFTVLFSLTVVLYTEVCFHSCVIHGGVFPLLCYTRRCVHIGGQGDSGRRQRRQLTILPPTFPATSDHGLCYGCVVLFVCLFVI